MKIILLAIFIFKTFGATAQYTLHDFKPLLTLSEMNITKAASVHHAYEKWERISDHELLGTSYMLLDSLDLPSSYKEETNMHLLLSDGKILLYVYYYQENGTLGIAEELALKSIRKKHFYFENLIAKSNSKLLKISEEFGWTQLYHFKNRKEVYAEKQYLSPNGLFTCKYLLLNKKS